MVGVVVLMVVVVIVVVLMVIVVVVVVLMVVVVGVVVLMVVAILVIVEALFRDGSGCCRDGRHGNGGEGGFEVVVLLAVRWLWKLF